MPKKILIVEDEKMIVKPLDMKLKLSGFDTKVANDGEEAMAILAQEKFDLILLDLMMPKMDGFGVLAEMKKKGDMTPVIVATNLNQEGDISKALELGVSNYYVKADTSLNDIVENVKNALNF